MFQSQNTLKGWTRGCGYCRVFPHDAGGPQLSAVVNAAGITRDKNLLKMTEQAYDEVIKINLKVLL